MKMLGKIVLLPLVCLSFAACDLFQKSPSIQLNVDDLNSARQGFEEGLVRKIHAEGGQPKNVLIEEAAIDPKTPNQVLITYQIIYTIAEPKHVGPMLVTYKGKSTLQASKSPEKKDYVWHVTESTQLDYAVEYVKPRSGA